MDEACLWVIRLVLRKKNDRATRFLLRLPSARRIHQRMPQRQGRKSEARAVLNRLQEHSAQAYVSPADLSLVYAGLGENNQALRLLEKACKRRLPSMVNLKVDPSLDNLRSDPRFQDLLHLVGFPQ